VTDIGWAGEDRVLYTTEPVVTNQGVYPSLAVVKDMESDSPDSSSHYEIGMTFVNTKHVPNGDANIITQWFSIGQDIHF